MRGALLRSVGGLAAVLAVLAATPVAAKPVVVELFQSQGCSSCPPANANLVAAANRPDLIELSFEVTYWDHLGWKDPFDSPTYTARQVYYAKAFHRGGVFTPQVVVDGRLDGVGADPADFARLVGHGTAAAPTPSLSLSPRQVAIGAGPAPAATADVWLVRYDPRLVRTPIGAGENTGKTLAQRNIVRELVRVGSWRGAAEALRLPAPTLPGLTDVVLIQLPNGGPILAAARA
jgi:hypothetical protein